MIVLDSQTLIRCIYHTKFLIYRDRHGYQVVLSRVSVTQTTVNLKSQETGRTVTIRNPLLDGRKEGQCLNSLHVKLDTSKILTSFLHKDNPYGQRRFSLTYILHTIYVCKSFCVCFVSVQT